MPDDKVFIFDTTLRDGEQSPGASLSIPQKLEIAQQLAALGVDIIEAGFPVSSPAQFEATRLVAEQVQGPVIAGLARAKDVDIEAAGKAVAPAKRRRIHTFIATSDIHLQHKLRMTREQVIERAVAAVKRALEYCDDVEFSAEDAARSEMDYLCQVIEAVIAAGAKTVNIPDTVGYSTPMEYGTIIRTLKERVPNIDQAIISVHCHDDLGMGVANSLSAVMNGARQVECTINGIGERAGNAAMEEIVMAIATRGDIYGVHTGIVTTEIARASRLVSDLTGIVVQPNKAVVGANAFAHEAGIHQHGVMANRQTYEIMTPESVGVRESKLVLGKHSGRHAFDKRLQELGFELTRDEMERAFNRFKELADKKKELFDEDLAAIVADEVYTFPETYHLEYLNVMSSLDGLPTATIRMRRDGEERQQAAIGVGCVDAVYKTMDLMIDEPHELVDYVVRSVTGGTDALADVTVKVKEGGSIYTGRAASLDIVQSSARAYIQAINKLVHLRNRAPGNLSDRNL